MKTMKVGVSGIDWEMDESPAPYTRHNLPKWYKENVFDTIFLRKSINELKY